MTLAAGVFAQSPGSPLAWAKLIAEREYRPQPLGQHDNAANVLRSAR